MALQYHNRDVDMDMAKVLDIFVAAKSLVTFFSSTSTAHYPPQLSPQALATTDPLSISVI